ncbi:MAG: glycosyltransferase [Marinilabiliales bacterium]|nr:MAG: glycosyltransferase [Marinilabiliales bacterium]
MKLSVIIVNYNVEYFLEQCLLSVRKAMEGIDGEVIVVDNNSVDGSVRMIKDRFTEVKLIENKKNLGFSQANNQAIKESQGEFVLLLNPDTVVDVDTFRKSTAFMDDHKDAGGLGVMMVDGKGQFLPESKRGLPTPEVSFYKIFGLSKLFKRSKRFGKYHLTYLDKSKIHKVDVLSGAFMMLRKSVLDKIGLLDEDFFMYGEDIDLSYRIKKAGYENYYFPETRIIHYKGESTKKSSVNYVFIFYNAMIIFAKKHFKNNKLKAFIAIIHLAIYFRAFLALLSRFFRKTIIPLTDIAIIGGGIYGIAQLWQKEVIFPEGGNFPVNLLTAGIAVYTFIWILSVFLNGGYDKPIRLRNLYTGIAIGTGVILIGYSLLPEAYRFSRAIILLGATWVFIYMTISRFIFHALRIKGHRFAAGIAKRLVIIGDYDEAERVRQIIEKSTLDISFMEIVSPEPLNGHKNENFIGGIDQIDEIVNIYKVNEVVFCAKSLSAREIIDAMANLNQKTMDFRIAPPETLYIIGSQNINYPVDHYVYDINNISKARNLRRKRVLDINTAFVLLIFFPLTFFIVRNPFRYFLNIFSVLLGFRSWVGFNNSIPLDHKLPNIKKGILNPVDFTRKPIDNPATIDNLNILYARDYKVWYDIQVIIRAFRQLGRK